MTRVLFWIALIILVVMAIRSKLRAAMAARGYDPQQGQAPINAGRRRIEETEAMACCAHCGVYFPSSEAVRAGGRDFCSPAHAQLPAATPRD